MDNIFKQTRRMTMLMFEHAEILDVVGPLEVFDVANRVFQTVRPSAPKPYTFTIVAQSIGPVVTSSGMRLCADECLADFSGPVDTLLVAGGVGTEAALHQQHLIAWLQNWSAQARRVASVCTGAYLLAEAGLLNGKPVTTHWASADDLQRRYPILKVDADPLFIKAGRIYTAAGVTAGIDLALALVEEDLGRKLALAVARGLVVFLSRPGGQKQFSHHLHSQSRAPLEFSELVDWLIDRLAQPLTVAAMANHCAMSPRHFARQFQQKMGATPARYLEQLRLEKARNLLEQNGTSIKTTALSCGFSSAEHLRRSFQRNLSINPSAYQTHF